MNNTKDFDTKVKRLVQNEHFLETFTRKTRTDLRRSFLNRDGQPIFGLAASSANVSWTSARKRKAISKLASRAK